MGVLVSRREIQTIYDTIGQGLFIFEKEKNIPKGQSTINLGSELSAKLLQVDSKERENLVAEYIFELLGPEKSITITHWELLFTPSLKLNPIAVLLSMCRNRKICISWPGKICGEQLIYEEPGKLEYYNVSYRGFIDTYIVLGGM